MHLNRFIHHKFKVIIIFRLLRNFRFISDNHYNSFRSHVKVVVLGAAAVGKTTLIHQALNKCFLEAYKETVEDTFFCKGDGFLLEITDTSGSYNFPEMTKIAIMSGDVFLLVFSVTDSASFDRVVQLRKQIIEMRGENALIVVCGNKADLPDREVDFPMADSIISIDWECRYHDVSAMNNEKCCDVFDDILRMFPALHQQKASIRKGVVTNVSLRKQKRKPSKRIRCSVASFLKNVLETKKTD